MERHFNALTAISRTSIFCFSLFLYATSIQGQTNESPYLKDLQSLRAVLEKTPSFKTQIRGTKLEAYSSLFDSLSKVDVEETDQVGYFKNLARLFYPIMDNHLGFYQVFSNDRKPEFPRFKGDLDSLGRILDTRPLESIEGIYNYGENLRIGVFKSGEKSYTGVVLKSKTDNWEAGQFIAFLENQGENMYKALYFHPKFKTLIYYPLEKYLDHTLANSYFFAADCDCVYTKAGKVDNHNKLPRDREDFIFKSLKPGIKYLGVANFSADPKKMEASKIFLETFKDSISGSTLILDLRNNQGGAQKVSKTYLSVLKKHAKKSSIYVLINNGTISQGEIFTLQLKGLKNVYILGQNSNGTLAYGSNYGRRQRLPSGVFEVYPTDMFGYGKGKLLQYENVGVSPDRQLSSSEDWIEQTLRLIESK